MCPTLGRDGMLLVLTWAAGSMDAISYLGLGQVFTAMMTGNTVLLALALGRGELLAVLRSLLALGGFVAGAAVGALILERDDAQAEWPTAVTATLACEAVALAVFEAVWHLAGAPRGATVVYALIVVSGLAMGLQAIAVRRLGVPGVATTYITGTITSLAGDLVVWLRSPARGSTPAHTASEEPRVGLLAGVFAVYGLGALIGGLLQTHASPLATLSPLIAVALVVGNACLRRPPRGPGVSRLGGVA